MTKLSVCDRFATGACGNRRARGEGQARARFGNARMPRAVGVSETARRGRGRRTLGSLKVMPGSMGRSTPMSSGAGVRSTPGKACGPGSESRGRRVPNAGNATTRAKYRKAAEMRSAVPSRTPGATGSVWFASSAVAAFTSDGPGGRRCRCERTSSFSTTAGPPSRWALPAKRGP